MIVKVNSHFARGAAATAINVNFIEEQLILSDLRAMPSMLDEHMTIPAELAT
jgi:hypothetical protein